MPGERPSTRLVVVAVVAVLAACALAAWLVFDVGCDVAPDFLLFRQFCDKDFWSPSGARKHMKTQDHPVLRWDWY